MINLHNELQICRLGNGIKLNRPNSKNSSNRHVLKNILALPFLVYFENTEHVTLKNNASAAREFGFASQNDAAGQLWHANCRSSSVIHSLTNDKKVTTKNLVVIAEEEALRNDGYRLNKLSIKMPWFDNENNIIGLFGCSIILGKNALAESLTQIAQLGLFNLNSGQFPDAFVKPTVTSSLSKREIDCLRLTVKGKPAKEVAYELNLSPRTVEEYLTNIKRKLGVFSKAKLIEKALAFFN